MKRHPCALAPRALELALPRAGSGVRQGDLPRLRAVRTLGRRPCSPLINMAFTVMNAKYYLLIRAQRG